MRLAKAIELFLNEGGFKPETIRLYRRHLLEFQKFIGNIEICDLTRLDITHFKTYLLQYKTKLCTYKHLLTIRSLLSFLKENDIDCLDHFKIDTVKHDHWGYIKDEDVKKALKLANEKYKTIILLMYTAGLRISEVCNLQPEDIDFHQDTIKVLGKGDKYGTVFISPQLKKQLIKYPPPFHVEPHTVRQYFHNIGETLGIWFHCHALRKSFATNIYRQSGDLLKTSKLLRHSSVTTTQEYAIVEDQELQEFHNKYISENHELNFEMKKGGHVIVQLSGWCANSSKQRQLKRAINKAVTDILE